MIELWTKLLSKTAGQPADFRGFSLVLAIIGFSDKLNRVLSYWNDGVIKVSRETDFGTMSAVYICNRQLCRAKKWRWKHGIISNLQSIAKL